MLRQHSVCIYIYIYIHIQKHGTLWCYYPSCIALSYLLSGTRYNPVSQDGVPASRKGCLRGLDLELCSSSERSKAVHELFRHRHPALQIMDWMTASQISSSAFQNGWWSHTFQALPSKMDDSLTDFKRLPKWMTVSRISSSAFQNGWQHHMGLTLQITDGIDPKANPSSDNLHD